MSNNFYQETILYGSHYPSNPSLGMLFFNTSNNTLNIYLNGKWFDITGYFYNYFTRLVNSYNNLSNNVVSSISDYQNFFVPYQNEFNQLDSNYTTLENNYNQLLNDLNNLIPSSSSLIPELENIQPKLNSFTNPFYQLKNNLQSNFVYISSLSFQCSGGYYIYSFNFSNLYNSYISAFNGNFNVFAVVRRPIDYYDEGSTPYPIMYHVNSDLIYNPSNKTGTLTIAIGNNGSAVSNLSQGFYFHDYSLNTSAELYEVKFFAGPFNTSNTVTSNLSSSWYFNQYYGATTYSGSNVSTTTLNIFGYNIGVAL